MPRGMVGFTVAALVVLSGVGPAGEQTHLGQSVNAHVMLKDGFSLGAFCGSLSFTDRALFRIFPNGTRSEAPFQVPRGQVLVVTDVEWNVFETDDLPPLVPGSTLHLRILLGPTQFIVFQSRGVPIVASGSDAQPGTSEQLTAGFLVGPDTTLCPHASQAGTGFGKVAALGHLVLRGYLIATK